MRREVGVILHLCANNRVASAGSFASGHALCPPEVIHYARTYKDELDVTFVMDSSIDDGVDLNFLLFPRGSELPL